MTVDPHRARYTITTDPHRFDIDAVHTFLSRETGRYWAQGISKETLAKAIAHSLCFALLDGEVHVGFARVVTDRATYAYLCDVYVLESHRGHGLGKWLIETVMTHPELQDLRRFQLVTRDAHGLYTRHGFAPLHQPELHLEIFRPGIYLDGGEESEEHRQ